MRRTRAYYDQKDLFFSTVFGSGIYFWDGTLVRSPLGGESTPCMTHVDTRQRFFLKGFSAQKALRGRIQAQILRPPLRAPVLWPRDMLSVAKLEGAPGEWALLFPWEDVPPLTAASGRLAALGERWSWKQPQVRDMAVAMVRAVEDLNRWGYVCLDLQPDRFFFREDGSVLLEYSPLIFDIRDTLDAGDQWAAVARDYPIEFADPAVVRKHIPHGDYHSQNHSLAALLCYLLLNRHPYDGAFLDGYREDSPTSRAAKFQAYHSAPVFLFDPEDRSNALGAFADEQYYNDLWEELPPKLQALFLTALTQSSAERSGPVNNPTPSRWLACFRELGWMEEKEVACHENE